MYAQGAAGSHLEKAGTSSRGPTHTSGGTHTRTVTLDCSGIQMSSRQWYGEGG